MLEPQDAFNRTYVDLLEEAKTYELHTPEALAAFKTIAVITQCQLPPTETPDPEPTTKWGRFKRSAGAVLDNETTRTLIKAGGAFGGVALVGHLTVRQDRVLDRTALAQANQRNS